ncbi:MAG: PRC-barrel domain-containing protein [Spirochaetota bacterium]
MNPKKKNKLRAIVAIATTLALIVVINAGATGTYEEEPAVLPIDELNHESNLRLSELFDMDVQQMDGSELGTIVDAMIDVGQGSIAYVVVEFRDDSIREAGTRVPMPIYLFDQNDNGGGLRLLLEDETYLGNMPTLEEVNRETAAPEDTEWARWTQSYWNVTPPPSNEQLRERLDLLRRYNYTYTSGPRVVPTAILTGSELLESRVRDAGGRSIGSIEDAVINLRSTQLLLLAFRPASGVDADESRYLIPPAAFTGNRETGTIALDLDRYGLGGPSGFTGSWPAITDADYHEQLARYWNTRDVGTRYGIGMRIVPVRMTEATMLPTYDFFTRDSRSPATVVDTLVNPDGSIEYVLIEFGAFIGLTGERSAVPISLATVQPVAQSIVLNVLSGDLESLPRYPAERFVDTTEADWDARLRDYWNSYTLGDFETDASDAIPTVASLDELDSSSAVPASALIGSEVQSQDGTVLGSVDNLHIDLIDTHVAYAAVGVADGGLISEPLVPIPLGAMEYDPAEQVLIIDATVETMQEAPGYDSLPLEPELSFISDVEEYWAD